jgi:hypothetical protein
VSGVRKIYLDNTGTTNLRKELSASQQKIAELEAIQESLHSQLDVQCALSDARLISEQTALLHNQELEKLLEENVERVDILARKIEEMRDDFWKRQKQQRQLRGVLLLLLVLVFVGLNVPIPHGSGETAAVSSRFISATLAVVIFLMTWSVLFPHRIKVSGVL